MRGFQRFSAVLFIAALAATGCDPGYRFDPTESATQSGDGWVIENGDLRVRLTSPGGTVLSTSLAPEPIVENLTQDRVRLLSSRLATEGQTYNGSFGRRAGQEVTAVELPPQGRERVPMFFSLDKPLRDALGERVTFTLSYVVGDGATQELSVPMQRRRSG